MTVSINTPSELLDLLKQRENLTSDYQVTKVFSIPSQTVSRMRNNKHALSDYYILYICHILELEAPPILASMRIHDAKVKGDGKSLELWENFTAA